MPKTVIARYSVGGEHFEIFVDSDLAYNFITGKNPNSMLPLQAEEVFVDANKGERAGQEKLKKAFGTTDIAKIAETIMKHGNVPITTEQRRRLLEEKRKQVIEIIATNSIDPKSGAPHPMQRIENAMETAKVQIEPFKSAKEQVDSAAKSMFPPFSHITPFNPIVMEVPVLSIICLIIVFDLPIMRGTLEGLTDISFPP